MSQIENNFIYDDKGVVANLVKPFERKDRFPSDKTTVFGSYSTALDYANNNPSAYVGQIISVVDEGGDVKVYKLIPSSSGETGYATLKEIGEGGNTSIPPADFDPPIVDLEGYATKLWVNEQGYITLDDIPEVAVPSKTSDLTNDSGFITINDVPKVAVPTKVSDLENDSNFITPDTISDIEIPQLENYVGKSWAQEELVLNDNFVTFRDETYQEIQKIYGNIDTKANSSDVYVKNEVYTQTETNTKFLSKAEAKDTFKVIDVFTQDRILTLNQYGRLSSRIRLEFNSDKQTLVLYGNNNSVISEVDISNVISSGFLKDANYDDTNKTLVFTFITEDGTDRVVTVNLGDIFKTYTPGEGINITNNGEISIHPRKLEEIQAMGADIVRVEGLVNTAQDGVDAITADYLKGADKTELESEITAAHNAAEAAQDDVDAIVADYLKKSDKTELEAKITAAQSDLNTHTGNSKIHVTTDDKAKWDEVTNKAAKSDFNALVGRVSTAESDVDAIAADYLKGADKTELEGKIAAAQSAADAAVKGVDDFNSELVKKEDKLIDGVTIKTINGMSILGEGNIEVTSDGIIDMSKYVSIEKFEELESKYTSLNNVVETLKQEVQSLKNGNINVGNAITELKSGSDDIKIERNGSVVTITLDDITNVTFGDGEDIESCDEIEGDESF